MNIPEPSCGNCKFHRSGTCRRNPPTLFRDTYVDRHGEEQSAFESEWPRTDNAEWCGEYLPDAATTKAIYAELNEIIPERRPKA